MTLQIKRVAAVALAVTAAFVGLWAAIAPHSFFTSFPLPGHHWVVALPAYNEHLTRDVGGLYIGLGVAAVWVVVRPRAESFNLVGAAWLFAALPHFIYHSMHLDVFSDADAVANMVTLGLVLVLSVLLLWPVSTRPADGRRLS